MFLTSRSGNGDEFERHSIKTQQGYDSSRVIFSGELIRQNAFSPCVVSPGRPVRVVAVQSLGQMEL